MFKSPLTHLFSNSLFSSSNFSQIKRKTSPGIQSLQEKTEGFKIALQKTEILPLKKHFKKKTKKNASGKTHLPLHANASSFCEM